MLHRYILDAPSGTIVDHIDGDWLNAQESNLRYVSKATNQHNSDKARSNSGKRGVTRKVVNGVVYWVAYLRGKTLGRWKHRQQAVYQRLRAEAEEYGIQPRRITEYIEEGFSRGFIDKHPPRTINRLDH